MTPERVLQHSPLVLDHRRRERYFADGFLAVPGYIDATWLDRLRAVVAMKIDESGTDVLPGDVANVRAAGRVEFGPDLGDPAASDAHVG